MTRAFTIIEAEQRSPEWFAARLGRVTGSKAKCVLMGAETAGRADYMLELALQRITGMAEEPIYVNAEMQRGIDKEPLARMQPELRGAFIRETGFLRHDTLMIGTSLDGDEDDFKTIWEFKCPKSTTHLKYLKSAGALLLKEYQPQIMHAAFVIETAAPERAIIGSFDDRLPLGLEWIQRETKISDLPVEEYGRSLHKFMAEVDSLEAELRAMQQQAA